MLKIKHFQILTILALAGAVGACAMSAYSSYAYGVSGLAHRAVFLGVVCTILIGANLFLAAHAGADPEITDTIRREIAATRALERADDVSHLLEVYHAASCEDNNATSVRNAWNALWDHARAYDGARAAHRSLIKEVTK